MGDSWGEQCARYAQNILQKNEWKLVADLAEFTSKVCSEIRENGIGNAKDEHEAIRRRTKRNYSVILYEACGETDLSRREEAFGELWRHFYSIIVHQTSDEEIADEVAQQALVKTFETLGQCNQPDGFLAFAEQIAIHLLFDYFRKLGRARKRQAFSLDAAPITDTAAESDGEPNELSNQDSIKLSLNDPPVERMIIDEFYNELLNIIRSCTNPGLEQTVLVELLVKDKEFQEIAQDLHLKVNYVRQLKYRGLGKLNRCEAFLRFLDERLR